MDTEEHRKQLLEKKYHIELKPVPDDLSRYKILLNGIQQVFTGLPPIFTLDQIDGLIPELDNAIPGWREVSDVQN